MESQQLSRRIGLLNGLLIGLALAVGTWGADALFWVSVQGWVVYPSLIVGGLLLTGLGGLTGWLTARINRAWAGLLLWLIAALLMMRLIGHIPYEGRTWTVWLADRRAWGLPIYPYDPGAATGVLLAGFFAVLALAFLGLLQPYRTEGIAAEADDHGRLGGRGWFLLLLPLPLVLAVGLLADSMVSRPLRQAPQLVREAIRTGRTYPGDLFELSLREGLNYNAIAPVREQMSEQYRLSVGAVDLSAADTIFVVADFDNGAWIACRILAGHLSFCYDASPPYRQGFPALIATGETPPDCPACDLTVDDDLRAWLRERAARLGDAPRLTRLAQWGSYVWLRAESPDGSYAIECRFRGFSPVHLEACWEK
ncbi:MAG TPA: hypothetical protein ENJ31_10665 [Anaerolineae bacterium]|nr:hypothetical protein [Anaerolineae bacterium]